MLNTPFAFMAGEAAAGAFDPTLGGSLTPYFWYDFTDSTTMTFSSGTDLDSITSKGTNTGTLAKGTASPKYTTNWNAPQFDGTNLYTHFRGTTGTLGATNSSLARRYGTGNYANDLGGQENVNNTLVMFFQPDFASLGTAGTYNFRQVVSWKVPLNPTSSQAEEWSPVAMTNGTSYTGTTYYMNNSPSSNVDAIASQFLGTTNRTAYYSYDGAGYASGLGPWNSMFVRRTAGTGNGTINIGRNVADFASISDGPRDGTGDSAHEGLCVGNRSRDNESNGTGFYVRHLIIYNTTLSDTNVNGLISSYNSAYPSDGLNP